MMCFGGLAMWLPQWRESRQNKLLVGLLCVMFVINIGSIRDVVWKRLFYVNEAKEKQLAIITEQLKGIKKTDYVLASPGIPIDSNSLKIPITHIELIHRFFLPYRFEEEAFYKKWEKFDLKNNKHIKPFTHKQYIVLSKKQSLNTVDISKPYLNLIKLKKDVQQYPKYYEDNDIIIYKYKEGLL